MAISFPQDVLLFNILPRLPTKSISRFMCVSKQLYSFLSSDMFQKMLPRHLDHHQNPEKLLVVSGKSPHMFSTFNFEALDRGLVPRCFRRPFVAKAEAIGFVTSFHGLVCLGIAMNYDHYTYSDLILWNPLTSDYKTLSKTNSHKYCYYRNDLTTSGLLYNSCEDDYKLVRVVSRRNIVFIYSLKSDTWRRVDPLQGNLNIARGSQSICLNGNLYFGTLKRYGKKYSVTRFDTNTEKLEDIEVPSVDDIHDFECASLMVQGGCLHLCIIYIDARTGFEERCIQLWKMIEDGCWNNVVTFHLNWKYYFNSLRTLMRDGKLLILRNIYGIPSVLYEVDLKNMQHSKGKEKWCNVYNTPSTLYGKHQVRYVETFVSPNLYSK